MPTLFCMYSASIPTLSVYLSVWHHSFFVCWNECSFFLSSDLDGLSTKWSHPCPRFWGCPHGLSWPVWPECLFNCPSREQPGPLSKLPQRAPHGTHGPARCTAKFISAAGWWTHISYLRLCGGSNSAITVIPPALHTSLVDVDGERNPKSLHHRGETNVMHQQGLF